MIDFVVDLFAEIADFMIDLRLNRYLAKRIDRKKRNGRRVYPEKKIIEE